MTKELWTAAGRPKYRANATDPGWIPFFETTSGLLEGLIRVGVPEDKAERRYTPWSWFFRGRMGCGISEATNPYLLREHQRRYLLGLNWANFTNDPADPTGDFEQGAMFVLFTLANLPEVHDEKAAEPVGRLLSSIASGDSAFRPDYKRDGEAALVSPVGTVTSFDKLDLVAEQLGKGSYLFTNDFMKSWDNGLREAKYLSTKQNQPVVYVYLAQDILALPWTRNSTYRKRLEYIVRKALLFLPKTRLLKVISHGWSGHIVASIVMPYANVEHLALGPSPGPWGKAEYLHAVRNSKAKTKILVGEYDLVSLLGGGSYKEGKMKACY